MAADWFWQDAAWLADFYSRGSTNVATHLDSLIVKSTLEEAARVVLLDSEFVAKRIQANFRKRGLDYSDSARSQAEDRVR